MCLARAFLLVNETLVDPSLSDYLELIFQDIILVGVVLVVSVQGTRVKSDVVHRLIQMGLLLILVVYSIDLFVQLTFGQALDVVAIQKYAGEWQAVLSYFSWYYLVAILGLAVVWRFGFQITKKQCTAAIMLGSALVLTGLSNQRFLDLTARPSVAVDVNYYDTHHLNGQNNSRSTAESPAWFEAKNNIILLIVESMSAEDSLKTSGLFNRLSLFDSWSNDGMLYTNFIANYSDTEGGLVALFNGVPPVPFPGGTRSLYRSFGHRESVVDHLNSQGYHTEFLTTAPISFLSKDRYLSDIGFTVISGRDEVERFGEAPRGSFDSAPDEYLYAEALNRIAELSGNRKPYFLSLLTVTSHSPMIDPDGRGNSEDNVWEYVDRQLHKLYQKLRSSGFFENGVLIVTSDHRKMYQVPASVRHRYRQTSEARIPLVLVGKGVPAGVVDTRLFQQADLLKMLSLANAQREKLTTLATYVERYTKYYTEVSAYGALRVIDQQGETFLARLQGTDFRWEQTPPVHHEQYTFELHQQRLESQLRKQQSPRAWRPEFDEWVSARESRPGLSMEIYRGIDINGHHSQRNQDLVGGRVIAKIDFGDLKPEIRQLSSDFSLRIFGKIQCEEEGRYWFRLSSDDGSGLAIDGQVVIDASYTKSFAPEDGTLFLSQGKHLVEVRYFEKTGAAGLRLEWMKPGEKEWSVVPAEVFSH